MKSGVMSHVKKPPAESLKKNRNTIPAETNDEVQKAGNRMINLKDRNKQSKFAH